ncbi:hypothetical protein MCEREM21A_02440 [Sphingomonadaceae bacterium]
MEHASAAPDHPNRHAAPRQRQYQRVQDGVTLKFERQLPASIASFYKAIMNRQQGSNLLLSMARKAGREPADGICNQLVERAGFFE